MWLHLGDADASAWTCFNTRVLSPSSQASPLNSGAGFCASPAASPVSPKPDVLTGRAGNWRHHSRAKHSQGGRGWLEFLERMLQPLPDKDSPTPGFHWALGDIQHSAEMPFALSRLVGEV